VSPRDDRGGEREGTRLVIGSLFRWVAFAYGRVRALTAALALPAVLLAPSLGDPHNGTLLGDIKARGALRVVTLNSPTTYYQGREGPAGLEHDLAKAYADHLGVELEVLVRATIAEVLDTVDAGNADIAAAGLTISQPRLLERSRHPRRRRDRRGGGLLLRRDAEGPRG
jgi:hypothetical protein